MPQRSSMRVSSVPFGKLKGAPSGAASECEAEAV